MELDFGTLAACRPAIKIPFLGSLQNGFFGPNPGQERFGNKFLAFEGFRRSTKKGSKRTMVEGGTEGTAARKEEEQEEGMKSNMTGDHWAGGLYRPKEVISLSNRALDPKP